jgi:glycosyltransferase involved in cell wall biosynthesis
MDKSITIIIPCYNENPDTLKKTVRDINDSLNDILHEILIIDDCSSKYSYDSMFSGKENISYYRHKQNKGYGASIKTGILKARYSWIGITDADATYPNLEFKSLMQKADGVVMVIGARKWDAVGIIRRIPKYILTRYASYLAGYPIKDLNSGMRVFKKEVALEFWKLFPSRFSFTSTITMSCVTNGYEVEYVDIDYFKREGKSNISPIKDTIRFFSLVTKLSLYFNPLRFFFPLSLIFFMSAIARGVRDYISTGALGGLALVLFFMAFQVFFFGLLAQIISKTRSLKY